MTERRNLSSRMNSMDIGPDSVDFEPRVRRPLIAQYPPLKTTIAAVVLLLGGIIFLSLGLSIMFSSLISHGKDRGLAMVILGGLMFIPGSYASTIIYGTWAGWSGYDYDMVPSYDDA